MGFYLIQELGNTQLRPQLPLASVHATGQLTLQRRQTVSKTKRTTIENKKWCVSFSSKLHLFICCVQVCTCSRVVHKLKGRRQLSGVSSLLPPCGPEELGSRGWAASSATHWISPQDWHSPILSHHPFLRRSLSVYPGLVWNFWNSSRLNLPSSGITGIHHHTCIATSNLLLVKWTKSRVDQFLETATKLHKWGNVLVFIVHTPSKSQVWGNIQVKQLSFINRWIVRRRKKWDRKHQNNDGWQGNWNTFILKVTFGEKKSQFTELSLR